MTTCAKCKKEFETIRLAYVLGEEFTQQLCETCQSEQDKQLEIEENIEKARLKKEAIEKNVPIIFRDARMKDFHLDPPVTDWIESPEGFLFIWGECGTGKSRLACAATMRLRSRGISTGIVFSSDLFVNLRASFNGHGKEIEIIDQMSSGIVMIFDDIGAQKLSDYAVEAWYTIIDRRYRNGYPTMFTSNLSLKEISVFMSDRVASRLASGLIYQLTGPDRRFNKRGA